MQLGGRLCVIMTAWLAGSAPALAHFQLLKPSTDVVTEATGGLLQLDLIFTHPMAGGPVMPMARPVRFGVQQGKTVEDLLPQLVPQDAGGVAAWRAAYEIKEPDDYIFFVEPAPYWEPAEQTMIVHYAKVVVDGFGAGTGWDELVGLPVEIQPLVRPYGLWTGNLFRGVVLEAGQPVPFAEIEVEWLNDGSVTPPAEVFVTQVIKADAAGAFAYAMPRAGWWGFAALLEADQPAKSPDGADVPLEQGALMWVRAVDME